MIKNKAEIFKNLLAKDEATLLPVVHDCLTAKIAERTGFEAVSAGLSSVDERVIKTASNYITSDIVGLSKSTGNNFTLGKINWN